MGLALTRRQQEVVVIRDRRTKVEIARVSVERSAKSGCRLLFNADDDVEFVRGELIGLVDPQK